MSDICANKHGGNPESIEAYGTGKHEQRKRVFEEIVASGIDGVSCDELAKKWGVHCNAISGRFSELKKDGKIRRSGTRPTRSGKSAGVYVKTLETANA